MQIKRLLVATDLSDASAKSLQCAVMVAKKFKSEIVLLHIFEVADVDEHSKQMLASNFLSRDIKRQLQESVQDVETNEGIKATYLTKDGELFSLMAEAATETHSDIMFIGTHGVHGVQHITGSFLAKTINSTSVPVWVIQKDTKLEDYQNIFVFVDEFPEEPLHPLTLQLARHYNSKMHFVFTEPEHAFTVSEMIQNLKNTLDSEKIEYDLHFLADDVEKQKTLVDMAAETKAALIIMYRNGREVDGHIPLLTNKHYLEVLCI